MSTYNISKIQLPNGDVCNLKDQAIQLTKTIQATNLIHIEDAVAKPLKDCKIFINPAQAGSGDPSPSNVRSITGWTGAKVTRTGKNLWSLNDTYTASGYSWVINQEPMFLRSGIYTFSADVNIISDTIVLFGWYADGTRIEIARLGSSPIRQSVTKVIENDIFAFSMVFNQAGTISDIQLESGSTATSYEPYTGQTVDVQFPAEAGTVYGGTLDVTAGTIIINRKIITFDGNADWQATESKFYISLTQSQYTHRPEQAQISNMYVFDKQDYGGSANVTENKKFYLQSNSGFERIWVYDTDYTLDTFKALLNETSLQFTIPINPVTINFTETEINTITGVNNIWTNAGNIAITYYINSDLNTELNNYVQKTDYATSSIAGIVKIPNGLGLYLNSNTGAIRIDAADSYLIKGGTNLYKPICPAFQHQAVFYGLAKAAGDTTQTSSNNAVGTYTANAKAAIKSLLGINTNMEEVVVSGTTPTINANANTKYICGQVSTITIVPPASGICDIRFTSGTTATVLTANGVKWPAWFDPTDLESNAIYEINIDDGEFGAVILWPN